MSRSRPSARASASKWYGRTRTPARSSCATAARKPAPCGISTSAGSCRHRERRRDVPGGIAAGAEHDEQHEREESFQSRARGKMRILRCSARASPATACSRSRAPTRVHFFTRSSPTTSSISRADAPRSPAGARRRDGCSPRFLVVPSRRGLPAAARARPRRAGGEAPVDVRPALQGEDRRRERTPGRSIGVWDADLARPGRRVEAATSPRFASASGAFCSSGRAASCSEPANADEAQWTLQEIRAGRPLITARDAGPVRAADGELRDDRRRRLPEGLLSRPGDRRARAVPRPGEAPHGARARAGGRRAAARRRSSTAARWWMSRRRRAAPSSSRSCRSELLRLLQGGPGAARRSCARRVERLFAADRARMRRARALDAPARRPGDLHGGLRGREGRGGVRGAARARGREARRPAPQLERFVCA